MKKNERNALLMTHVLVGKGDKEPFEEGSKEVVNTSMFESILKHVRLCFQIPDHIEAAFYAELGHSNVLRLLDNSIGEPSELPEKIRFPISTAKKDKKLSKVFYKLAKGKYTYASLSDKGEKIFPRDGGSKPEAIAHSIVYFPFSVFPTGVYIDPEKEKQGKFKVDAILAPFPPTKINVFKELASHIPKQSSPHCFHMMGYIPNDSDTDPLNFNKETIQLALENKSMLTTLQSLGYTETQYHQYGWGEDEKTDVYPYTLNGEDFTVKIHYCKKIPNRDFIEQYKLQSFVLPSGDYSFIELMSTRSKDGYLPAYLYCSRQRKSELEENVNKPMKSVIPSIQTALTYIRTPSQNDQEKRSIPLAESIAFGAYYQRFLSLTEALSNQATLRSYLGTLEKSGIFGTTLLKCIRYQKQSTAISSAVQKAVFSQSFEYPKSQEALPKVLVDQAVLEDQILPLAGEGIPVKA